MIEALYIPHNINTHFTIDNFTILEYIDTNYWGDNCKIIQNETNMLYLSTIINKKLISNINLFIQQLQNHIHISDNPYIHKIEAIIENNQYIYILYEYHDLHIKELINKWNEIDIQIKLSIFSNIAHSINACHSKNITHMNILLDNIYIDSVGTTCLTNFSSSIYNISESEFIKNVSIDCIGLGKLFKNLFSTLNTDDLNIPWIEINKIEQGLLEDELSKQWNITKLLHHLSLIGY